MKLLIDILREPVFYFIISLLIIACFRGCLVRIPYATILSTLISSCGLIIGLAALYDTTSILDRMTQDLLKRKLILLDDLKLAYVFVAIFIIVVIFFNLIIGFIATDQSLSKNEPGRKRRCTTTSCIESSTTVFLLQTFLVFNYMIYYLLLVTTIISFILLFICYVLTVLCNDSASIVSTISQPVPNIPTENRLRIDLQLFGPVLNLPSEETGLLDFKDTRLKKLCVDYMNGLMFHSILCAIGFLLSCIGFVNYLINFSVNAAKLSTKQKFEELIYLNNEMATFDARY